MMNEASIQNLLYAYVFQNMDASEVIDYIRHDYDFVDRLYIDIESIGGG